MHSQESQVPEFIKMTKLTERKEGDDELDEYAIMAGFALKDEDYQPQPIIHQEKERPEERKSEQEEPDEISKIANISYD